MFIIERNSDHTIVQVSDDSTLPSPDADYTAHDVPGFDWSTVNRAGVDMRDPAWLSNFIWNGSTIVKRP